MQEVKVVGEKTPEGMNYPSTSYLYYSSGKNFSKLKKCIPSFLFVSVVENCNHSAAKTNPGSCGIRFTNHVIM